MDEAGALPLTVHASCVSIRGQAVLVLGPSGSGKSGLCLELMALGAWLVADDRVVLERVEDEIEARAPEAIRGRIEARFVGILSAEPAGAAHVKLVVDLGVDEVNRLPPHRSKKVLGKMLPLLHNVDARYFPAAILQYVQAGRSD